MRKLLFYPVTVLAILIIQMVILKHIRVFDVFPDLFLLATIFFALRYGPATGMHFGFFSGLVEDAFLIGPFGANALVKTAVGFFVGYFQKKVYDESVLAQVGIVFLFSFFYYWGILLVNLLFGPSLARPFVKSLVFSAYNAAAAPLVFFILRLWGKNDVAG